MRMNRSDGRRIVSKAILVVVVVSIIAQPLTAPAAADISKDYTLDWTGTHPSGELAGVAMDSSGNVYIVQKPTSSSQSLTVRKFDSNGNSVWSETVGGSGTQSSEEEQIAVNGDGVYVFSDNSNKLYMLDKGTGNTLDSISSDLDGEIRADDGYVTGTQSGGSNSGAYWTYSTSSSTLSVANSTYTNTSPWTVQVDDTGDTYITRGASGITVLSQNLSGLAEWNTGPGWLPAGGETISVNGDGDGTDAFAGQSDGNVTEVIVDSSDNFNSRGWETSPTAGSTAVLSSTYISDYGALAVGDSEGNVYVMNESDGSTHETMVFADTSDVTGVASNGNNLVMVQRDGSIRYYSVPPDNPVVSINMTISDKTLKPTQSTSYSVTGTKSDSTTSDVTSSSDVTSDDTSVVSVDEVNTEIDYQGDGTTVVRAKYTNGTGAVLWDNETVETDTPQVKLTVNANPIDLDKRANYTVEVTVFGSTSNVTGSSTVTSDNVTAVTVTQSNSTYKGENVGIANLTADYTTQGETYSDKVKVEVVEPQEIIWANWQYLNGGEKMILMLSDWSILYMFGSLIVSTMIAIKLTAPRVGIASFGSLIGAGWIIGFVPNYVTLSLLILLIFYGFFFEFVLSPSAK